MATIYYGDAKCFLFLCHLHMDGDGQEAQQMAPEQDSAPHPGAPFQTSHHVYMQIKKTFISCVMWM